MKLTDLKLHADHARIHQPTDLTDLKNSLSSFEQMEPIAINKNQHIISGHRRSPALEELSWDEPEVRIVKPENEIITLIEHNRHPQ